MNDKRILPDRRNEFAVIGASPVMFGCSYRQRNRSCTAVRGRYIKKMLMNLPAGIKEIHGDPSGNSLYRKVQSIQIDRDRQFPFHGNVITAFTEIGINPDSAVTDFQFSRRSGADIQRPPIAEQRLFDQRSGIHRNHSGNQHKPPQGQDSYQSAMHQ